MSPLVGASGVTSGLVGTKGSTSPLGVGTTGTTGVTSSLSAGVSLLVSFTAIIGAYVYAGSMYAATLTFLLAGTVVILLPLSSRNAYESPASAAAKNPDTLAADKAVGIMCITIESPMLRLLKSRPHTYTAASLTLIIGSASAGVSLLGISANSDESTSSRLLSVPTASPGRAATCVSLPAPPTALSTFEAVAVSFTFSVDSEGVAAVESVGVTSGLVGVGVMSGLVGVGVTSGLVGVGVGVTSGLVGVGVGVTSGLVGFDGVAKLLLGLPPQPESANTASAITNRHKNFLVFISC